MPEASKEAICAWSYPISPRISVVCWPRAGATPMSGSSPAEKSSGDRTRLDDIRAALDYCAAERGGRAVVVFSGDADS